MKFRIVILLCLGWILQPATAQPQHSEEGGPTDRTQSDPISVLIIGPDPDASPHLQQDDDLQSLIEQQQALTAAYNANPIVGGMLDGAFPGQQISAEHLNQMLWMLGAYPEHEASFWENPDLEFGIGMSIQDYAESAGISVDEAREVAISQSESFPFLQPGLTGGYVGPDGEPLPIGAGPGSEALSNDPLTSGSGLQAIWWGRPIVYVGIFSCNINAQSPHIGASSGTVKAKVGASCVLTPTGAGTLPPENQTIWTLRIALSKQGSFRWRSYHIPIPIEEHYTSQTFSRRDHRVDWQPNRGGGSSGTQVDSGVCSNGLWKSNISIFLFVPSTYVVVAPYGSLVDSATRSNTVYGC